MTRKETVGFFNCPGLKHFGNRYGALLTKGIRQLDIDSDWTAHEDLYAFVQKLLTGPAIEAMCGPVLLAQSPTFVHDFWKLDSDMLCFFKGYPRLFAPRAWQNRTRILKSLKKSHAFARDNLENSCIEADGHDRFYGSPLMRSQQGHLPKVDSLDADALASQGLGLIRAENANSIPAVFWMIFEALQRPHLLSQTQEEVLSSQSWSSLRSNPSIDLDSLCSISLFHSMYAETLRFYTSLFALPSAAHEDFKLGNFSNIKDELIAVDSRVAAMNKAICYTGPTTTNSDGAYPLDVFWTERSLTYPHDPRSGPLRFNISLPKAASSSFAESTPRPSAGNSPCFTMDGLVGAWLSFGGGSRQFLS